MSLAERIAGVERRIADACRQAGRLREAVTLVAVSKRKPASAVRQAYALGLRDFGESYAQELRRKADALADLADLRWHFIGHLQRNKAQLIVGHCALIHSVDSASLLQRIDQLARKGGVTQDLLIQLNISAEPSKSGAPEADLAALLAQADRLERVRCLGLMTMPPYEEDPSRTGPLFERLRQLRDAQRDRAATLPHLSMGMSHDFEIAIAQGATQVRIGSSIFGPRD